MITCVALVFLFLSLTPSGSGHLHIETPLGAVQGHTVELPGKTLTEYLGIPFSQPPIGDLRWRVPLDPKPWNDTLVADSFGPSCYQGGSDYGAVSEDCLYLNIWAPQNSSLSNLPVAIWIYGGSFVSGGSNLFFYNGSNFASQNVIIVTINYRVGPFGFFVDKHLEKVNFGLRDQAKAMEFVHKYIHHFGGNPDDVTIFGESAGAISICAHLVIEQSWPYFHKALMESGSCLTGVHGPFEYPTYFSYDLIQDSSQIIINSSGCNNSNPIPCLKSKSAQEIHQFDSKVEIWWPVIDGDLITDDPLVLASRGKLNPVPIVTGTNKNESGYFVLGYGENISKAQVEDIMTLSYGSTNSKKVADKYKDMFDAVGPLHTLSIIETDAFFRCPARRLAKYHEKSAHVYMYLFDHVPSYVICPGYYCKFKGYGTVHTFEIPFVYGIYPLPVLVNNERDNFTLAEYSLSQEMGNLWTDFFKNGLKHNKKWRKWDSHSKETLHLTVDSIAMIKKYDIDFCDFWDSLTPIPSPHNLQSSKVSKKDIKEELFLIIGGSCLFGIFLFGMIAFQVRKKRASHPFQAIVSDSSD